MNFLTKCIFFLASLLFLTEAQIIGGRPALKLVTSDGKRRGLQSLSFRGAEPASALGQCEGDCDVDDDCLGSLVCYLKDAGGTGAVPGCSGRDTTRNDFCVDPADLSNPTTDSSPAQSPQPPSGTPPTSEDSFKLKMYWEEGYYWQEETFERKWCMRCRGGSCSVNDHIYIEECSDDGVQRFVFEFVNSDEALIKLRGTNHCLERSFRDISVKNCNADNNMQRWWAKTGGFDEDKFEISQLSSQGRCVTNDYHHPKSGELVHLARCSAPRNSKTSFWERCYSNSC